MDLTEYARKNAKALSPLVSPRWNRYLEGYRQKKPGFPSDKQIAFLLLDEIIEAFYGGAAGGGKTEALVAAGAQYLDCPGYNGIIFRRTFKQLHGADGLVTRLHDWLAGTGCIWHEQKLYYESPEGGRLYLGAMERDDDKYSYDGTRFDFIGFDELTHFLEPQYTYLFSRLRRALGSQIPPRARGASNPGKVGHAWVKKRFITEGEQFGRPFIPARMDDNPGIDKASYERALEMLPLLERKRIKEGDWDIGVGGVVFDRAWFKVIPLMPRNVVSRVRYWDLAYSTDPKAKRTAAVRMSRTSDGLYVVEHAVAGRWRPGERDEVILQTAQMDGKGVHVYIEKEGGSGGPTQNAYLIQKLAGYPVNSDPPVGKKEVRAAPFASQAEAGFVRIVEGPWNQEYLDELQVFPEGDLMDLVDASSGAFSKLVNVRGSVSFV